MAPNSQLVLRCRRHQLQASVPQNLGLRFSLPAAWPTSPRFCVRKLAPKPVVVAVLGTSHAKIVLRSRSFKDTRGLGIANSKRRGYIPPEQYIDTNECKNVINVKCNVNTPSNKSQRMKCTQPSTTCKRTPPQVTQIAQRSYHHSPPQESGRPRAPRKKNKEENTP